MKALHVIPAVAPRYGGPSVAVFEMCRALRMLGVDAHIATTDADGRSRLPIERGRLKDYRGVPTIFFRRSASEAFKYSHALGWWLDEHVADYDLVHIHAVFSYSSLAAARACSRRGVPFVVRPLGSLDPWSLGQRGVLKRLLWYCGVASMLREAAALHFTTDAEQRLAGRASDASRGAVVPLGVDLEAFVSVDSADVDAFRRECGLSPDEPYVLFLGRLHPKKRVELLIDVFLDVARNPHLADCRLVVAGDGEAAYVAELKRRASQHPGAPRVVFSGWLGGRRKLGALHGASLLALPSRQENLGLVALESLACGTPVLVSEHVNLAADIRQNRAGWITTLDASTFAAVLVEALTDERGRVERGKAARAMASQYSWARVATTLNALYSSIRATTGRSRLPAAPGVVDEYVQQWISATNGRMFQPLVGRLRRYPIPAMPIRRGAGGRLLDVGCGWGRWMLSAARHGYAPVGLDIRREAARATRRVLAAQGVTGHVVVADLRDLPFRSSAFDVVFSYSSVQHTHRDRAESFIREAARVLNANGRCAIQFANRHGLANVARGYVFHRREEEDYDSWCVRYYSVRELRALFGRVFDGVTYKADCFFGLGVQRSDLLLLSWRYRPIVLASELAKLATRLAPPLRRFADSLWVTAYNVRRSHHVAERHGPVTGSIETRVG